MTFKTRDVADSSQPKRERGTLFRRFNSTQFKIFRKQPFSKPSCQEGKRMEGALFFIYCASYDFTTLHLVFPLEKGPLFDLEVNWLLIL
jgi:hypothetical protein